MISPQFIDHLVFRVSDLGRTERFYTALLSQSPVCAEDSLMYTMGDVRLFFTIATNPSPNAYDKETVGLNHIAFGLRTLADLQTLRQQLDAANIHHSGIKLDSYGRKEFIWLDDPDGMRVELYLRPKS
ncbi:MAG: VOC family protein [Acidobacteriaceae bacterium]